MSDLAFTRSDLFSIPAAEQAELAAGNNPSIPLTGDAACTPAEAAFTLHCYHRYDLLWRLGVMCPMPIPAQSGTGRSGITVSRTTHDLLPHWARHVTCSHTCQLRNAASGSVLHAFGDLERQRGTGGIYLVISDRGQRTESGR